MPWLPRFIIIVLMNIEILSTVTLIILLSFVTKCTAFCQFKLFVAKDFVQFSMFKSVLALRAILLV